MGAGVFWGILIILLGLSVILKGLNLNFPIFKIIFGIFFIYLGVKIISGGFASRGFKSGPNDVVFGEKIFEASTDQKQEYNIIFGKGEFDLSNDQLENQSRKIKIATIFGGAEVKLANDMPVKIMVNSVFGGAKLPNGNSSALGTTYYQSENFNADSAHLFIKADVVFGGVDFNIKDNTTK